MKSLHIFLITVLALSILMVFGTEMNNALVTVLFIAITAIGASFTARAIKNGL